MRGRALLPASLLAVFLVSCGSEEGPSSVAPTTTVAAIDADAYELDVIAEAEPDEGEPPLKVQFLGYIEEDEGGPWTFHWDFGDGNTSDEQNPVHVYEKLGEYTAVLTVTDQRKYAGSDEIDVFVEPEDF